MKNRLDVRICTFIQSSRYLTLFKFPSFVFTVTSDLRGHLFQKVEKKLDLNTTLLLFNDVEIVSLLNIILDLKSIKSMPPPSPPPKKSLN